jgi:hypothetical protein
MKRIQIDVNNKAALVLNIELTRYKNTIGQLLSTVSNRSTAIFLAGIVTLAISILILSFACYQKHKQNLLSVTNKDKGLLNLNNNGISLHRYKEIIMNSDEENVNLNNSPGSNKPKFQNKKTKKNANNYLNLNSSDNKRLLFDEDDENDSQDEIFIR